MRADGTRVGAHIDGARGRSVSVVDGPAVDAVRDMPPSLLLTVSEVERELRLGRTRVYQLLRAGEIPFVRVGERAIRVTREDLTRWIASKHWRADPTV